MVGSTSNGIKKAIRNGYDDNALHMIYVLIHIK